MAYSFFAFLNRMKLIERWGLMRNTLKEDVAQHTTMVAIIAHALALIDNKVFANNLNADRVGMLALFHEVSEVFTGDLPTPIKYQNDEIKNAYKTIEAGAESQLLKALPSQLKDDYNSLIKCDKNSYEYLLVKRADKLAALIKCIEELSVNNREFSSAKKSIQSEINAYQEPCVKYFVKNFIDAFSMSLDEISNF